MVVSQPKNSHPNNHVGHCLVSTDLHKTRAMIANVKISDCSVCV